MRWQNFFYVLISDNVHKLLICRYLSLLKLDRARVEQSQLQIKESFDTLNLYLLVSSTEIKMKN